MNKTVMILSNSNVIKKKLQELCKKKMARENMALQKELDEQLKMLQDLQAKESNLLNMKLQQRKKKKQIKKLGGDAMDKAQMEEAAKKGREEFENLGKIYVDERKRQQDQIQDRMMARLNEKTKIEEEKQKALEEEE